MKNKSSGNSAELPDDLSVTSNMDELHTQVLLS
jgi:hypothetical protein